MIENLYPPVGFVDPERRAIGHPEVYRYGPSQLTLAVDRSDGPERGRLYVAWVEGPEGTTLPLLGGVPEIEPNNIQSQASPMTIGQSGSGHMSGQDCDWFRFEGTAGTTVALTGWSCGAGGTGLYCGVDPPMLIGTAYTVCTGPAPPVFLYTLPTSGRYYVRPGCSGSGTNYGLTILEFQISASSVARDQRDIVLSSSSDGGTTWSPRARVNDCLPGCDDAMPALAVDGRGRLHLAWYDRRNSQVGCSEIVHTYWTYSTDGGASFAPAVSLSNTATDLRDIWARQEGGTPLWTVGDYLTLAPVGNNVHAFWTQAGLPNGADPVADIYGAIIEDESVTETQVLGFRATPGPAGVRLWWKLRDASSAAGFRVHRAIGESEPYAPLGDGALIAATAADVYEIQDATAVPGMLHRYRLEVVRPEGSLWQGPIEVRLPPVAARMAWMAGCPNPFGDAIELRLLVPVESHGTVTVFDVTGHEVRSLHRGPLSPGTLALRWDGRDSRGRRVPAGMYLVQASVAGETRGRRVVRVE